MIDCSPLLHIVAYSREVDGDGKGVGNCEIKFIDCNSATPRSLQITFEHPHSSLTFLKWNEYGNGLLVCFLDAPIYFVDWESGVIDAFDFGSTAVDPFWLDPQLLFVGCEGFCVFEDVGGGGFIHIFHQNYLDGPFIHQNFKLASVKKSSKIISLAHHFPSPPINTHNNNKDNNIRNAIWLATIEQSYEKGVTVNLIEINANLHNEAGDKVRGESVLLSRKVNNFVGKPLYFAINNNSIVIVRRECTDENHDNNNNKNGLLVISSINIEDCREIEEYSLNIPLSHTPQTFSNNEIVIKSIPNQTNSLLINFGTKFWTFDFPKKSLDPKDVMIHNNLIPPLMPTAEFCLSPNAAFIYSIAKKNFLVKDKFVMPPSSQQQQQLSMLTGKNPGDFLALSAPGSIPTLELKRCIYNANLSIGDWWGQEERNRFKCEKLKNLLGSYKHTFIASIPLISRLLSDRWWILMSDEEKEIIITTLAHNLPNCIQKYNFSTNNAPRHQQIHRHLKSIEKQLQAHTKIHGHMEN